MKDKIPQNVELIKPGFILLNLYIKPYHYSEYTFSLMSGIPTKELTKIVSGEKPITEDIAKKIGKVFPETEKIWLQLEANYRERLKFKL